MGFDIGAASQFLQGYLGEQERLKEKEKKVKKEQEAENTLKIKWAEQQQQMAAQRNLWNAQAQKARAVADARRNPTPWSKSGVTLAKRSNILGDLRIGIAKVPTRWGGSMPKPIKTREEAVDFIIDSGYLNYKDDPEIMTALQRFPSTEGPNESLKDEDEPLMDTDWQ